MADSMRIAAAQSVVTTDARSNGAEVRRLMVAARERGAQLIHFTEGAISGYADQAKQLMAGWRVDWAALRQELQLTASLAGELRLWVVLGSNHRLTGPHRPHNSMYVISDAGELVGRYDKRLCSYTEITDLYTPGFEPWVFEVDGYRFGCILCIEVNFPELWLQYATLGVDCVLFSSFSEDPIFDVLARGHAAANSFWVSVAVPAQCSAAMPAGVIGPHGYVLASCRADGNSAVVCVDLDRADPKLDVALHKARPWRATARAGAIYEAVRVDDPRSEDRTQF